MEVLMCDGCGAQIKHCSWYTKDEYDFCTRSCKEYYVAYGADGLTTRYDSPERARKA